MKDSIIPLRLQSAFHPRWGVPTLVNELSEQGLSMFRERGSEFLFGFCRHIFRGARLIVS